MATIGITGGTGFVGRHLTDRLVDHGHNVVIFTRDVARKSPRPQVTFVHWNSDIGECDINGLRSIDAMVHLAGAGIANKRWTEKRKQKIRDSRVNVTDFLVSRLKEYGANCKTLVSASAIGFYGADNSRGAFREDATGGDDFLAGVCREWEAATANATPFTRTVILRFGMVLGKDDGAFPELTRPMALGVVPIVGNGRQMVSWIEISDLTRLILHALENKSISGIYNAVAPYPVSQEQLIRTIATERGGLRIPVPAPPFMLRLMLGELSGELLKSCTVSSEKIISTGFSFDHPAITGAVKAILGK